MTRIGARRGVTPVRCETVQTPQNDQAKVVVLQDERAARRQNKSAGQLTRSQVERLLVAAELRKKATEGEHDE